MSLSVLCLGIECQRSVNDFWSCIFDCPSAVQRHWPIIIVLAAVMGKNACDDIATASKEWGSTADRLFPWGLWSVSNGSKFRVRFWFQVGTEPWPLKQASAQNLILKCQHFSLRLSVWVLIVSPHNVHMKYVVCCSLSASILRCEIGSIFVGSHWKTGHFGEILAFISQWFNEY